MWAQIGTFIIRAAPKAISMLLSPGKAKSIKFAATVDKLKKSKTYKAAAKFLNEDPTDWAKRNLKKSFENGDALKFLGGVASGLSEAFSSFTPKPRPIPSGAKPRTSSGALVPGAKNLSNSMANTTRAYNTSVRNLSKIAVAPPKGASKKVFDQYRASFSKRNVTLGELTSLNVQVTKKARDGVYSLGKGIEQSPKKGSLRNIPQVMKIRPAENMKESSSKELSNYIQSTINTSTETISKDIDIVNQNLEKVMSGLAKAQSDSNKSLAMNLGNFTAQNISELARIITKSEETSFRKQQESSYYQTEVLSNKMDESHRYNAASLNAVREDILANTQSMYALEQESRRIDAEYREYEERKNAGVTLPALYGLTKQVGDMVQMTFRSHSEYDKAAQNAFMSLAGEFAYELGKMAGFLKEAMAAQRKFMCKIISGIEGIFSKVLGDTWGPIFATPFTYMMKITGKLSTMLDGMIFNKLLGIKSSVLEDAYGATDSDCFNFIPKDKTTEEQKKQADSSVEEQSQMQKVKGTNEYRTAGGMSVYINQHRDVSKGKSFINGSDYAYEVNEGSDGTLDIISSTGKKSKIKLDKKEGESTEDFHRRAYLIVAGQEIDESMDFFDNENKYGRVDKNISSAIYKTNIEILNKAVINYNLVNNNQKAFDYYINRKTGEKGELINNSGSVKSLFYGNVIKENTKYYLHKFARKVDNPNYNYAKKVEIRLDNELIQRLTMALKQAALKGIPARVTDTLRLVPIGTGKLKSNHSLGIAVDICVPNFDNACYNILVPKYGKDLKGAGSYAAVISVGEMESVLKGRRKGTDLTGNHKLSNTDMAAIDNMMEWMKIAYDFGLSTGIVNYPAARTYRREKDGVDTVIDVVHVQLAKVSVKSDFAKKIYNDNVYGEKENLTKKYQDGETDNTKEDNPDYILGSKINTALSTINTLKTGKDSGLKEGLFGRDKGEFEIDGKKVFVNFTDGQFLNEKGELIKYGDTLYNQERTKDIQALREIIKKSGNIDLGGLSDDELERFIDIGRGYYGEKLEAEMSVHYEELRKMLEEIKNTRDLNKSEERILNFTYIAQQTTSKPSVDNDLANIDDQSKKLN